jgi:hypothetical protein
MTYEATLMFELEPPIPFTCAAGTGIEKGCIAELADPMTVTANNGDEDIVAGITATEKIASDGKTKVAVYRRGIFKMYTSGAITIGQAVATKSTNLVKAADATCVGSKILGIALEASSADDVESILVDLNPGCANNNAY